MGCTGVGQPCDVGIQRPFKLAVKQMKHADIVNESLARLTHDSSASLIRLDTTIGTLRDRSLQWVVNGYHAINKPELVKQAFFMCKAGEKFNLSFASLTSWEALQYLRDVQKNDPARWARIATAQYKTDGVKWATNSESEDEASTNAIGVESLFDDAGEHDLDASDVPMDALLDHMASEGEQVCSDYHINADGGLSCANHSEVYDVGDIAAEDVEGGSNSVPEVVYGCGKHRRITNSMYNDFWSH
ncbi:uncharacterized protein F5891DRAFT_962133 [Suillus fuscotomentosus]|uniref:Uncharacterized protein n=1 Tax=Suillus fuscotomentosus TaxID=1912939 RepID=A0AAD4DW54_9AGAM|nr:uncharacterized protein F5891DRAFT_962133 [Suillus fuscotomentosus]KAG1893989.1 hypothetical protein F5891DRAFT_962133 [Suillus fuscotomentosus]